MEPTKPREGIPEEPTGAEQAEDRVARFQQALKRKEIERQIKREARWIGIAGIFVFLFMILFSVALGLFLRFFGVDSEKAFSLLTDPGIEQIYQIVVSMICFLLPFSLIALLRRRKIRELVPLHRVEKGKILPYFCLGLGACAFGDMVAILFGEYFSFIPYYPPQSENPTGFFGFLLSVLAIAVTPALVEEFAFRGIVMGSLRRFGDSFALFTSAILFGMMHGNFEQIPFAFTVGLGLGFLALKTESLVLPMLVHATNNLISVVYSYLADSIPAELGNISYMMLLSFMLLAGVFALGRLSREKDSFRFSNACPEITEKRKVQCFFTSFAVIVFLGICLVEAVQYF